MTYGSVHINFFHLLCPKSVLHVSICLYAFIKFYTMNIKCRVLKLLLIDYMANRFWGILCLSLLFSWQFYTIWILVNLHESAPVTGIRYSRYVHLSIVAFG